jgi:transcriptional repressor NrdR
MRCPSCYSDNNKVLESRSTEKGKSIRRRRECLECYHRFTTYERIEFIPITVIKRDGNKESFDRSKLLRGMVRACEKTKIKIEVLESIVDEIESHLEQMPTREISSQYLGNLVLEQLSQISEVAYVRFASVYGQFTGIDDFMATLKELRNRKKNQVNEQKNELNRANTLLDSYNHSIAPTL